MMSIAFPPAIEAFVEREVSSGAYASREDLIVAAVELLKQHQADHARLQADIGEGMEGEGIPAEQVFAELRAKYAHQ
jgi:putative addiction module CopG family antidote